MAWLRIDDKFVRHPKIAALSDRDLRVWLRVLCYCAEYKTGGKLPDSARVEITGLDDKTVTRYVTLALLDRDKQGRKGLHVHDWKQYNDPDSLLQARDRQRRFRERQRDETVPRARARARVPVPSPLGDKGREVSGAPPLTPNGEAATSQLENLAAYVHRVFDDYPDPAVLYDDLILDRGATSAQANQLIDAERKARTT